MSRSALFIITEDPRVSGRPAEAVRIAAGVSVWKKVKVALYLRGAAVAILGENIEEEELVDAENFARYLPLLAEEEAPIYAQSGAPDLARLRKPSLRFTEISDARLAELSARQDCVLRF